MALILTEEQKMLKDSAKELLATKSPVSKMRDLRDSKYTPYDPKLWDEMVSMGWSALTIPESYNGLDFGFVGLGQVLEQTGRNLSKSPLVSSILLGTSALRLSDNEILKAKLFPGIMEGTCKLAFAMQESIYHQTKLFKTSAVLEGENYTINGSKTIVIDGTTADHYIVVCQVNDNLSLFIVDSNSKGITISKKILMDSGSYADVTFKNVSISAENQLNIKLDGRQLLDQIMTIAYAGISAELLGICKQSFDITIKYLKDRQQFGVIIGTYQALQHRAVILFSEIELCKSIVLKALQAIDDNDSKALKYSHLAKAKLCKTTKLVTNEAIQLHGGIGVTDDADIGFYLKRARVAKQLFGDYNYHLDQLALIKGY